MAGFFPIIDGRQQILNILRNLRTGKQTAGQTERAEELVLSERAGSSVDSSGKDGLNYQTTVHVLKG